MVILLISGGLVHSTLSEDGSGWKAPVERDAFPRRAMPLCNPLLLDSCRRYRILSGLERKENGNWDYVGLMWGPFPSV